MTPTETVLWEQLRNRNYRGLKFRRQVNIGPFIADFLCMQHRLIVEVDGSAHDNQKKYDKERDGYLQENGYIILRVTNLDVYENINIVLEYIYQSIFERRSSPSPVRQEKE